MARLILATDETFEIDDLSNSYDIIFSQLESFDSIKNVYENLTNDKIAHFKIIRDFEDGTSSEEVFDNYSLSSFAFDASATILHAYLSAPPQTETGSTQLQEEINRLRELNESLTDRANAADILMGGI